MTINYQEFTENNIQFRIVSSKLLERYKSTQSFVLSEMLHGDYKFSKTSREISLLVMDAIFAWLIGLENYLIRDGIELFDRKAYDFATRTLHETKEYYVEIITNKKDIFYPKMVKAWKELHVKNMKLATSMLEKSIGTSDIEAFSTITNIVIEAMDSMKFELYEIDYLVYSGKVPFLCLTDLYVFANEEYRVNLLREKVLIYKEYFNIENGFVFKNYSQEINPITYIVDLEKHGVKIVNRHVKSNGYMYA